MDGIGMSTIPNRLFQKRPTKVDISPHSPATSVRVIWRERGRRSCGLRFGGRGAGEV